LEPGTLKALRKGGLVRVYWALPVSANGYRAIEIMRNTQEQAAGRARIRALRASITEIEDTVPDIQANYWYWLKVTHADGTIQNIGPISSPPRS
jgi:acyl carrier protein phosphodiesterase